MTPLSLIYKLVSPGSLVGLDGGYAVLHCLVCQGVHAAHEEVQRRQQLLTVLQEIKKMSLQGF